MYSFPKRGYLIVDLRLSKNVLSSLLKQAKNRKFNPIFKEVGCKEMNEKRLQCKMDLKDMAKKMVAKEVTELVRCVDNKWIQKHFAFLKSLPNGTVQAPHIDYTSEVIEMSPKDHIVSSVIVSLMEGTKIRVFPECFEVFNKKAVEEIVEIPPGFCIVFRGDLVHSGYSFTKCNYRIYCYLTFGNWDWDPDIVQAYAWQWYKCKYCDFENSDSSTIRTHRLHMRFESKIIRDKLKRKLKK